MVLFFLLVFFFVSILYTNVCIGYKCANSIGCLIKFMLCYTLCLRIYENLNKYLNVIIPAVQSPAGVVRAMVSQYDPASQSVHCVSLMSPVWAL